MTNHSATPAMPEVDRVAANRAAIAARRARAELKRRLRSGEVSPFRVLEQSRVPGSPAASLRITDYLLSFPAIGAVKAGRVREQLGISDRKRLGGLGKLQRERLESFVRERTGAVPTGEQPPLTVLAGPTAVGKGTVAAYIREHYPEIGLSVSATTRAPRPGEEEGKHYFFVDDEGFDRMLASDELLEWATVHNRYRYGTPRGPVLAAAERGEPLLLELGRTRRPPGRARYRGRRGTGAAARDREGRARRRGRVRRDHRERRGAARRGPARRLDARRRLSRSESSRAEPGRSPTRHRMVRAAP
jgi:guanylate kinase